MAKTRLTRLREAALAAYASSEVPLTRCKRLEDDWLRAYANRIAGAVSVEYHRDADGSLAGERKTVTMQFADFEDAEQFGREKNLESDSPYCITNISFDSRNFICFDLSGTPLMEKILRRA